MPILTTYKSRWSNLRNAVTSSDTPLSQFDYASWPTSNFIECYDLWNRVAIAFWGKGNDNATANYKLFARRKGSGPIMLVSAGVLTLGTQMVVKNPITGDAVTARWVDIITNTADFIQSVGIMDSDNNRICFIGFDSFGVLELYLEIELVTATEISAIICGA